MRSIWNALAFAPHVMHDPMTGQEAGPSQKHAQPDSQAEDSGMNCSPCITDLICIGKLVIKLNTTVAFM